MYFISGPNTPLYVALSPLTAAAVANDLAGEFKYMGEGGGAIDFGGCYVSGMHYIDLHADDCKYHILAHHLLNLANALQTAFAEKSRSYVIIQAGYFSHAIARKTAEAMLGLLATNWDAYKAKEQQNLDIWARGIKSLADFPGVDVRRNLAVDPKNTEVQ